METLTVDFQNEQEKKVLLAFLDSLNNNYQVSSDDALTDADVQEMLQRKANFLDGKTTARPWAEIKKRYDGV